MKRLAAAIAGAMVTVQPALAQINDGVVIRCGASKGTGYFFKDAEMNPSGPGWLEDGTTNGRIVLVKLGDEWDIQFDDAIGAFGYRQDGAIVVPLASRDNLITVGAFGSAYTDIFIFDLREREVAWSSNKVGPIIGKVSVYHAMCN